MIAPLAPWPSYAPDEIAAATAPLAAGRVNYWTGDEGKAFEKAYARHCGVRYGIAVANGTVAIELALYGLGIGPGDEVIVPARTFVATAAAVATRGARPVVVDIDPLSLNLTADTVAAAITPRTKAVIPVHLNGWPVDMEPLVQLGTARGLAIIEDCAQAHGASDRERPVGGIGRIGCFSFCQDKIITTGGEGGMVVTDDEALYKRMWAYRDHGRDYDLAQQPNRGGFQWLTTDFGTNWRLTESQSALGRVQLGKLPDWVARRRQNAAALSTALSGLAGVTLPSPPAHAFHSFYKFVFQIDPAALKSGWDRDRIITTLEGHGVPARVGGCPDISQEAAFTRYGFTPSPLPVAARLADRTIMLPVHPTLTDANVEEIGAACRAVISSALR
jgi:dTDP-4-amino-4,6-dideoxygalactose transaminase